jgi:RNA polymerase primary sigma factor
MKSYMRDISIYPLITVQEEVELGIRIRNGDAEARDKLIRSNLRLVVKIAHDFRGMGLPLPDLISEGNIGLMRAAEKFDPDKGAKFSSYASWWIKQAMRRAIFEKSKIIRVPVASANKIRKIRRAKVQLARTLGREPTVTEIAEELSFSEGVVRRLGRIDMRTVSLEDPLFQGESGELKNLIPDDRLPPPDHILGDTETITRLTALLGTLSERERTILMLRYGLDGRPPRTLDEVSRRIGRTRERVRQIQKRALRKLRGVISDDLAHLFPEGDQAAATPLAADRQAAIMAAH